MVRRGRVGASDLVWDIGAGDGALSVPLAQVASQVVAVEGDRTLAERLRARVAMLDNVSVVEQDFLTLRLPIRDFLVVANLPFAITTPVFRRLLDPRAFMVRAVLLVERGAARRFTECPSANPELIAWHTWFDIRWERNVARTSFVPPPGVDAAALVIERRRLPELRPHWVESYRAFLDHVLQDPPQPMRHALRGVFTPEQMMRALRALAVPRDAPAGTLTPRLWTLLYLIMRQHADPSKWPRAHIRRGRGRTRPSRVR